VSGFLANLYLNGLDRFLDTYPLDAKRKGLKFVRYADDLLIFVHKKDEALLPQIQDDVTAYLSDSLLLTVNVDKCRAIDANNGFDALGIQFTRTNNKTELRIARAKMAQIKEGIKNYL
jgi:hypothetical protein